MKRLILGLLLVVLMSLPAWAVDISGDYMWLPIPKTMTAGVSTTLFSFEQDNPQTIGQKILDTLSVKATMQYITNKERIKDDVVPDYGGLIVAVDVMKLATNSKFKIGNNITLVLQTGLLIDMQKLLNNPSELQIEPAVGASLQVGF